MLKTKALALYLYVSIALVNYLRWIVIKSDCNRSSIRLPSLKFVGIPVPKIWMISGHDVGDLEAWPLTFSRWNCCRMSAVARTTFLPILVILPLFIESLANTRQTEDMTLNNLDLWPFDL